MVVNMDTQVMTYWSYVTMGLIDLFLSSFKVQLISVVVSLRSVITTIKHIPSTSTEPSSFSHLLVICF